MNTEQENGIKHHLPIVYKIYGELKKNHIGRNNAIKAADLADKFGISKRELREHISTIRRSTELEKCVTSTNAGYFVCTSKEEFAQTNKRLLSMAFSLLRAARANEKKAGLDGQVKIALGKYFSETFEAFGSEEIKPTNKRYIALSEAELSLLKPAVKRVIKSEEYIAGSVKKDTEENGTRYTLTLSESIHRRLSLDNSIKVEGATLDEVKTKFINELNAATNG